MQKKNRNRELKKKTCVHNADTLTSFSEHWDVKRQGPFSHDSRQISKPYGFLTIAHKPLIKSPLTLYLYLKYPENFRCISGTLFVLHFKQTNYENLREHWFKITRTFYLQVNLIGQYTPEDARNFVDVWLKHFNVFKKIWEAFKRPLIIFINVIINKQKTIV